MADIAEIEALVLTGFIRDAKSYRKDEVTWLEADLFAELERDGFVVPAPFPEPEDAPSLPKEGGEIAKTGGKRR